jgi:hypothetical protein
MYSESRFNVMTDNAIIWLIRPIYQSPELLFKYSVESAIVIICSMLSDIPRPKVIALSNFHCSRKNYINVW